MAQSASLSMGQCNGVCIRRMPRWQASFLHLKDAVWAGNMQGLKRRHARPLLSVVRRRMEVHLLLTRPPTRIVKGTGSIEHSPRHSQHQNQRCVHGPLFEWGSGWNKQIKSLCVAYYRAVSKLRPRARRKTHHPKFVEVRTGGGDRPGIRMPCITPPLTIRGIKKNSLRWGRLVKLKLRDFGS